MSSMKAFKENELEEASYYLSHPEQFYNIFHTCLVVPWKLDWSIVIYRTSTLLSLSRDHKRKAHPSHNTINSGNLKVDNIPTFQQCIPFSLLSRSWWWIQPSNNMQHNEPFKYHGTPDCTIQIMGKSIGLTGWKALNYAIVL